MPAPLIAIIDDNPSIAELFLELLTDEGYRTLISPSVRDGVSMIVREHPDLVILDIHLEYAQAGWELVQKLRNESTIPQTPLIICSADATFLDKKAEDIVLYEVEVLKKPFSIDDVLEMVVRLAGRAGDV